MDAQIDKITHISPKCEKNTKRYAVTMVYSVWADSDEEAIAAARMNVELMDRALDNRAFLCNVDKLGRGLEVVSVLDEDYKPKRKTMDDVPFKDV